MLSGAQLKELESVSLQKTRFTGWPMEEKLDLLSIASNGQTRTEE